MIKLLLDFGVDPKRCHKYGSVLHAICEEEKAFSVDALDTLLNSGKCDVNAVDENDDTSTL